MILYLGRALATLLVGGLRAERVKLVCFQTKRPIGWAKIRRASDGGQWETGRCVWQRAAKAECPPPRPAARLKEALNTGSMPASPSSSVLRGPRQRTFLDMLRTITHTQHIVRSQSKFVLFRPSISSTLRHRARKINRHRHPTPSTSRQHHNYPRLGQHPRGDQPQPPLPPPSTPPSASTVNDDEISHFSRLSAQWWDERGEFGLLHKMNPHRIRFIREKVLEVLETQPDATTTTTANTISSRPTQSLESPRLMEGMDVLDVGCGGGILSEVRPSINPFLFF